jgi:hypothetical protein
MDRTRLREGAARGFAADQRARKSLTCGGFGLRGTCTSYFVDVPPGLRSVRALREARASSGHLSPRARVLPLAVMADGDAPTLRAELRHHGPVLGIGIVEDPATGALR